jgi:hypothetical protein
MFKTFLAVVLLAFASAAQAEQYQCSLWTQGVSRALFNNTGTFVTTGPALFVVPECVHTSTGFYGNLFFIAPTKDFSTGKEVDLRVGKRFTSASIDIDASAAYYYFGIDGEMYRTGDVRLRASRTFNLSPGTSITPYGIADYQRSFTNRTNSLGWAGGAAISTKLNGMPGKPTLTVDVAVWKYSTTVAANKGAILPLDVSLNFPVTQKVTLGVKAMQVWGNILDESYKPKRMAGVSLFTTF